MLESSRDMLIPRYSRCRDIVGSEYKWSYSVHKIEILFLAVFFMHNSLNCFVD